MATGTGWKRLTSHPAITLPSHRSDGTARHERAECQRAQFESVFELRVPGHDRREHQRVGPRSDLPTPT